MTARDIAAIVVLVGAGVAGGAAISPAAGVILGIVAAAVGFAVVTARVRWVVAFPVIIGTAAGAVLGWAVTHAFCRPTGCPVGEGVAAGLTGLGSFVGVGLVVALATRSFDEYRQAIAENRPPPTPGCETDEPPIP